MLWLYVLTTPDTKLKELSKEFNVSTFTVSHWLRRLGFSYKKAFTYVEANQEKRDRYLEETKHISPEELVYIDESGIEVTSVKAIGCGKKGKLLIGKKSGKYYQRTNILSGYVNKRSIAPLVFNGICNTESFDKWVEEFLIKELKPGQVVVMDNATFHKSGRSKTLIESVGCRVVFLPPYSPDLNPIEKFWPNMKR